MIAAESDEVSLLGVLVALQFRGHNDSVEGRKFALKAKAVLGAARVPKWEVCLNFPTQAKTGLEWATPSQKTRLSGPPSEPAALADLLSSYPESIRDAVDVVEP